jgi:hypothetical protein
MPRFPSRHSSSSVVLALACALVLAGTSSLSLASEKKRPAKVKFIDAPSSETPAAREKRLKRECKGRPNAGVCLGHTGR